MAVRISFDMKGVQDNVNRILGKKIKSIYYTSAKDDIAGEYAKYIAQYVPYKTGKLRYSAKIDNGSVVYSAKVRRKGGNFDYAGIQYYSDDSNWNRTTPGTYSHWNKHMTAADRRAFYDDVKRIIIERMNNE